MQSTPLLLRQLLRSNFNGVKTSIVSRPIPSQRLSIPTRFSKPICLRCRARAQIRFYSDGKPSSPPGPDKKNPDHSPFNQPQPIGRSNEDGGPNSPPQPSQTRRDELPSQEENRRSHLSKRFTNLMDNLQSNAFIAGQRLNDLTGYSGIEALKTDIEEQETTLKTARATLRAAKTAYTNAITQRSASQREVNSLLQRKHAWTPSDLERFTALYRSNHANEQAEAAAQEAVSSAERAAEEAATKLSRTILARYHEEQIWSDKIRRMSTWGTWGLMGVNVLLFLVFQVLVEPWRRRRLVKGFEEKVVEALEKDKSPVLQEGVKTVDGEAGAAALDRAEDGDAVTKDEPIGVPETFVSIDPNPVATIEALPAVAGEKPPELPTEPVAKTGPRPVFEGYRDMVQDLFSERVVSMSQRDVTAVALQGAAAGAAVVGLLVVLLRPK